MSWRPTTYLPPEMLERHQWEDRRSREICANIAASVVFAIEGAAALQLDAPKLGYALGIFSVASQLRAVWVAEVWQPPTPVEKQS